MGSGLGEPTCQTFTLLRRPYELLRDGFPRSGSAGQASCDGHRVRGAGQAKERA